MKWILVPLLWLLAVIVAVAVVYRLWRGRNVVLRGRWSPRFVRMVVIVLVVLGVGVDRGKTAPVPFGDRDKTKSDDSLPPTVTREVLARWVLHQQPRGEWWAFKQCVVAYEQMNDRQKPNVKETIGRLAKKMPAKFTAIVLADIAAAEAGKTAPPLSAKELSAALDELEKAGYFDHWSCAYLWRKTAGLDDETRPARVELFGRLHQHARVTNTLIKAAARFRVLARPRAWASKVSRPPDWRGAAQIDGRALDACLTLAGKLYASADAGTWKTDGVELFTVVPGSPAVTVIRGGQGQMPLSEGKLRIGRLDLIQTLPGDKPTRLEHAWLGRIELPAGALVSVWDLPKHLSDEAKTTAKKTIAEALDGDAAAANQLEQSLPLVQSLLREALAESPAAKGAPRLRLILALFDDVPMPSATKPAPAPVGRIQRR